MRLLSGHILPRNASNFTCSHLDLKNFPQGETAGPCLQGREGKRRAGGEGVKRFLPLKMGGRKGQEREDRERKVGEGKAKQQGDLAPRS